MQGLDQDGPARRQQPAHGAEQRRDIGLEQSVVEDDDVEVATEIVCACDQIGIGLHAIGSRRVGRRRIAHEIGGEIDADAGAPGSRARLPAQPALAASDIQQPLRPAFCNGRDDRRVRPRLAAGDELVPYRPRPVGGIGDPGAF